ncbi:MAG: hypothetical protein RL885_00960 [Planctomycetota bacterium]
MISISLSAQAFRLARAALASVVLAGASAITGLERLFAIKSPRRTVTPARGRRIHEPPGRRRSEEPSLRVTYGQTFGDVP